MVVRWCSMCALRSSAARRSRWRCSSRTSTALRACAPSPSSALAATAWSASNPTSRTPSARWSACRCTWCAWQGRCPPSLGRCFWRASRFRSQPCRRGALPQSCARPFSASRPSSQATAPSRHRRSRPLRASYGPGHALAVGWEWTYLVGDTLHRVALDAGDQAASFRDPEAERALLARAQIADTGLERFGLLDQRARPAARPPVTLHGVESMRFSTEVLPALERDGRFAVIVEGERPHYRDVGETLEVGISTSAIAGERDWFDLGVTIAVEGREVPFADVFAALARGETHMVLADGAHFSLLEPRLQALRALIEEARLLSDSPGCSPRISRYQAGLWGELVALGVVREQAQAWQRQVGALLSIDELAEHDPPAGMRGALRPYQLEGFRWLASLWELELGGILADDMGLGKTLQALALICHVHRRALRARAQRGGGNRHTR